MDAFVMVDWSAASAVAPAAGMPDGLWAAVAEPGVDDRVTPFRTRAQAREWVVEELLRLVGAGHRVLCGVDISFGYPAGAASALGMPSGATAWRWMWERVAREVRDGDDGHNDRFAAAARLNQAMGREDGPFWGNGLKGDITGLPRTKGQYPMEVDGGVRVEEFRLTERRLRDDGRAPSSTWQLSGAGSVGGQVLVGLPTLWRIRNHPALRDRCRVWPFELAAPLDEPGVTLVEVYPSLLDDDAALHDVRDARQVLALVDGYRQMAADGALADAFVLPDLDGPAHQAVLREEGWILPVTRDPDRPRAVRPAAPDIPRGLVEAIAAGRCVAFVGAGATSPGLPPIQALIADLASDEAVPAAVRRQVAGLLAVDPQAAPALEAAAQLITEAVPDEQLRVLLAARVAEALAGVPTTRADQLLGIPFAAILTTAVDPSLPGALPEPRACARLLRHSPTPWWHERHWRSIDEVGEGGTSFAPNPPAVLKLHGDVAAEDGAPHLVLTAADRGRLLASGRQAALLRAVLATHTILYLGVPLDDGHLTQLRAEVRALTGHDPHHDDPVAYAVVPDVHPELQAFYREHEGLEIIGGTAAGDPEDPLDAVLTALHAQAGHDGMLRRVVEGRTVLWVEPAEGGNAPGIRRLRAVIGESLLLVGGASEARAVLRSRPVDLVITHWGHREGGRPVGEEVLAAVRASRNPCPVLVFAWGDYADVNRPRALALGASDYVWTWPALFREVARILAPAPRNPWDLAPRLDG